MTTYAIIDGQTWQVEEDNLCTCDAGFTTFTTEEVQAGIEKYNFIHENKNLHY